MMERIAEEKVKYYSALKEEIKQKYRSKRDQEKLIKDKKHDEWTEYMSLKRRLVKKKSRMQKKLSKLKDMDEPLTMEMVEKKLMLDKEIRQKKKDSKDMQKRLRNEVQVTGKAKAKAGAAARGIHLDVYTSELKQLISKLNDDNLDAQNDRGMKKPGMSGESLNHIDEDPVKLAAMNTQPLSDERKEKLQIQLLQESQTYYMNNINIFANGLSLLSVNTLEVYGMVHQASSQMEEMEAVANNVSQHTKLMTEKTQAMIDTLKKVNNKLK